MSNPKNTRSRGRHRRGRDWWSIYIMSGIVVGGLMAAAFGYMAGPS